MIENPKALEQTLSSFYRDAQQKSSLQHRPVLASLTRPAPALDPVVFFSTFQSVGDSAFYWEQPDDHFAIVGAGTVAVVEPATPKRFDDTQCLWQQLVQEALIESDTDALATGPLAFGGFSFDPRTPSTSLWQGFPPARFVLPRFSITSNGSSWLTINSLVEPGTDPDAEARASIQALSASPPPDRTASQPHDLTTSQRQKLTTSQAHNLNHWNQIVNDATDAIRHGLAEKIVLARAITVCGDTPLEPAAVLTRLRETYGSCTIFAMTANQATFLGASPERLVRLVHGQAQVDCMAGSVRRGSTREEDDQLAESLYANAKERSEQNVVVQVLRDQLSEFCPHINMPASPVILRLPNVQHLSTPLRCHLSNGQTVLQLVKALHPTPATAGFPRDAARSFIREHENLDRGWYAGPIGWMDRNGEGEFAVAIRSALLSEDKAHLFAGCGIMADSNAEAEYQETNVKFESILSALNGTRR